MAEQDHPCANGLTPKCFEAYPEWAKLAFAYKLLHVLIPANISRRLPKGLFPGRIGPGAILPAGWIPPPGMVVPPGYTVPDWWIPFTYFILPEGMTWEQAFPPGWTAGDALPDGVSINANVVDVAGWSAGDALPDGVSINANVVDVAGWSAGVPMPSGPGVNTAAILPAGWSPTNAPPAWFAPGGKGLPVYPGGNAPPLYLPPWEPGPPHSPPQQLPPLGGYWFYDAFTTLSLVVWTKNNSGDSTTTIVGERLKLVVDPDWEQARIERVDAREIPTSFDLSVTLEIGESWSNTSLEIFTGVYKVDLMFYPPAQIGIRNTLNDIEYHVVDNFVDEVIDWIFEVRGGLISVKRNGVKIITNQDMYEYAFVPGKMIIAVYDNGTSYVSEYKITEI